VASTEDYVQRVAGGSTVVAERRDLTSDERLGDALFTGLRLNDGVNLSLLTARYQIDIWRRYGEPLAPYIDAGLLVKDADRLRLTRQGMLMAHEVMAVFV
jgi:oxygen-independent coproporphyrinogen-3 oxidase